MHRIKHYIQAAALAALLIGMHAGTAPQAWGLPLDPLAPVLFDEHADVFAGSYSGSWQLKVQGEESGTLASHNALLFVDRPARGNRPAGSAFDFIGVAAGQHYWRLPQSQNPQLLYAGANALGVANNAFGSYVETDPRVGVPFAAAWIKYTIVGVHGLTPDDPAPGHFSVWQSEDAGPKVWISSSQGGLTPQDALFVLPQSHLHYNWGFTARGIYGVQVVASAYLGPGKTNPTVSAPFTFYFGVEAGHPGDANLDSVVDTADYTLWADNYLQANDATWRQGDFNLDGVVDAADYTVWADNYGRGVQSTMLQAAAVPEPAAWMLLASGTLCAGCAALVRARRAGATFGNRG